MKRILTALLITFAMLTAVSCGKKEEPIVDDFESPPVLVEEKEHEDEPDEAVHDETAPDEPIPSRDPEPVAEQQEAPVEFSYKFAILNESHDCDGEYRTKIWYAIETAPGYACRGPVKVFKNGKDLGSSTEAYINDGVDWEVYEGYACTDKGYEDLLERAYHDSEILTIVVKDKESSSSEDFEFVITEELHTPEGTTAPAEYELQVNAAPEDITVNSSKYLYGMSLFRPDPETLMVINNIGTGTGGGSPISLGPTYGTDDESVQCLYKYNEITLIKGDLEHVRELFENNSKICYVSTRMAITEDPLLYTEIPEPENEDLSLFITANNRNHDPNVIRIEYGLIKKNSFPGEEIDFEPYYETNIKYTSEDGHETLFTY